MKFNKYAKSHFDWVEEMGWHNKPLLGTIAMIGSEIGEVAAEVLKPLIPTDTLGEELADVCLRIIDLMYSHGFDIDASVNKNKGNITWQSVSHDGDILELMVDYGHLVNSARYDALDDKFEFYLSSLLYRVINITEHMNIDLESCIMQKMDKNKKVGSKGRKV